MVEMLCNSMAWSLDVNESMFAEVLEDWEPDCRPQRFKYKDLHIATRGFKDQGLLGSGGFVTVYRGILPISKAKPRLQ
ncbi:hypothetical protein SAY86_030525 [Trapa natans]|uniref:Uncharacterized protein n=1 Tax=Trapa natans TaxID=22666 RepID=A0AAN7RAP7_TRANT|nr:hypothetical protein SAY86_030525 [Trapa natans]